MKFDIVKNFLRKHGLLFAAIYILILTIGITVQLVKTKPITRQNKEYIGLWESDKYNYMLITYDGIGDFVLFDIKNGGVSRFCNITIEGEYIVFDNIFFFFVCKKKFKITKKPFYKNGNWYMEVDNLLLKKNKNKQKKYFTSDVIPQCTKGYE